MHSALTQVSSTADPPDPQKLSRHAKAGRNSRQPVGSQVMEICKMPVEMADCVSQRRGTANAFFLTVNTTVAVAGLLPSGHNSAVLPICLAGAVVAICWCVLLSNYRKFNAAKFDVINKLERDYLLIYPFNDEWKFLGHTDEKTGCIKKFRTQLENVHNAWTAWISQTEPEHESVTPFTDLDSETQAADQPFLDAILEVAKLKAS